MQLKIRCAAIAFLVECGDNPFQGPIFPRNYKILLFSKKLKKALRLQTENILGSLSWFCASIPFILCRCLCAGEKRCSGTDDVAVAKVSILHRKLLPEPPYAEGAT